jgi:hypothetical protein
MTEAGLERMRRRVQGVRTRAAIQRWNYRQRDLAAGVWLRLRRVLADAREAYVVSDDDVRRLVTEGYGPEACGNDISPAKTIVFVDAVRLSALESRRAIPVSLGPEFVAATALVLLPFEDSRSSTTSRPATGSTSS